MTRILPFLLARDQPCPGLDWNGQREEERRQGIRRPSKAFEAPPSLPSYVDGGSDPPDLDGSIRKEHAILDWGILLWEEDWLRQTLGDRSRIMTA